MRLAVGARCERSAGLRLADGLGHAADVAEARRAADVEPTILDGAATAAEWLDPLSGEPLSRLSPHAWSADGTRRWPVVDGILFLRPDRDALRLAVLADLDRGDEAGARARLLVDQDPFAPLPPPSRAEAVALAADVEAGRATLRDAMRRLGFGPVADYFAHRTCTPTHLSGLGLLALHGRPEGTVVDVACGIGHVLRDLDARRVPAIGLDLVFAKLWLARRFVAPSATLVCGDATRPPLRRSGDAPTTVFCHDAFYFLPDKVGAAAAWRDLAGPRGRVLVGHAHNAAVDHGVAGTPLAPDGYAALFPGAAMYDDAEIGRLAVRAQPARKRTAAALAGVEAVSMAWSAAAIAPAAPYWTELLDPAPGARLVLNPLLHDGDGGGLRPHWPSERFAAEYRDVPHLVDPPVHAADAERALAGGVDDLAARAALARRRVLLDLPERW